MHFAYHIIVETLTEDVLDSLGACLLVLDHVMSSFEADLLNQAESELMARNDTIVIAGWDEDDEDLDVEWSTM